MSKGLVNRTERKFKRPKPGRTRLVKWPRTLLPLKVGCKSEDHTFVQRHPHRAGSHPHACPIQNSSLFASGLKTAKTAAGLCALLCAFWMAQDQVWDEPSFYAWTFDKPKGILYYVTLALIPLVVIAACLFPLAPW